MIYNILCLALAGSALFGLGTAIAWLFPAPADSQWVFRIAIAPLMTIAVTTPLALLLDRVGVPLHPAQLIALAVIAAGVAVRLNRSAGRGGQQGSTLPATVPGLHPSSRDWALPSAIVALAGLSWYLSMRSYGLYLPNRDFKNHAAFVAQIAWNRSADPAFALRASPVAEPVGAGYPLGLHTVLGWVAPSVDFNTLGLTAAAAAVGCAISLPLGLVVLARLWNGASRNLWVIAGLTAVAFPAATSSFGIGAVPILIGTAAYGAALASLWFALQEPDLGRILGLGVAALGLLFLHIAEAVALAMVAVLGVLTVGRAALTRLGPGRLAVIGVLALAAVVVASAYLPDLLDDWDIEPNDKSVFHGLVAVFLLVPGGSLALGIIWLPITLAGIWLALRRGLGMFPLVALSVPIALSILASASAVPMWLRILTAPWFGAVGRVNLLAIAPICLFASLVLAQGLGSETKSRTEPLPRPLGSRVGAVAVVVGLACLLGATAAHVVSGHRQSLAATLAGAGDTPETAESVALMIREGETVLNFEADGSANLFAAGRVPVLASFSEPSDDSMLGRDYALARDGLMAVADPTVAAALARLNVGYVAIGTTSLYSDSRYVEPVGYDVAALLRQPELSEAISGSDMVVLRYQPRSAQ